MQVGARQGVRGCEPPRGKRALIARNPEPPAWHHYFFFDTCAASAVRSSTSFGGLLNT
jgi:hypothetical protein